MCDATFTFGQRGSHFFSCPSRREVTRLPPKLTTLLSSSQIQQVHHVALGFQDTFLITWRDRTGSDRINSLGLPNELTDFLYARNTQGQFTRNIPAIRCMLGPHNSSFFAHDTSAYLWMNLPASLLTALQSRIKDGSWTDKPRTVALGADDNFVLITQGNAAIWALDRYKTVSDMLDFARAQDSGIRDVWNVVLHPYRYGCYIAQSRHGTLMHGNLPAHEVSGIANMSEPMLADTTERASRKTVQRRESEARASISRERMARVSTPRESAPRRPSALPERAHIRREWSGHTQQITAQSKGIKLSLSVSFGVGGLARMLG